MPSVLDREVRAREADAFGHRHFALALADLIESSSNPPPFSIGLLGGWGMGKSSIKELYLADLEGSEARSQGNGKRRERFHAITFNAWRYGGENVKRALLRHVFRALGGDEGKLFDALFNQITRSRLEARPWLDVLRELWGRFGWGLGLILLFFLIIGLIAWGLGWLLGLGESSLGLALAVLLLAGATLAKPFLNPTWLVVPRYAAFTRVELPRASIEQYEELLLDQLHEFKKRRGRRCERLVIFVDDLDRLSAEEMVTGLDAIRTFMDLSTEELPAGMGIVFVVSCDEERVARALTERGRSSDLPGAVFSRSDARRFLDRIFQFRLELPPLPRQDMRRFAREKLAQHAPVFYAALEQRDGTIDDIIDRLIHVDVRSPRNAVQLLNAFVESWWLAVRREREGAGTNSPGGLREGAVTDYLEALAAICALRVDFPDFYTQLERQPRLLEWFTEVFIRGTPYEDESEAVREALRPFVNEGTLKPDYRPLRRFASSLEGLRWPSSLQPLLLLSQDAITRHSGDRGIGVFEALVSGDGPGALRELGRDADGRELTREDVALLRSLDEDLRAETPVRRNNAAAVIAGLAARIPRPSAYSVLTPVARRLIESDQLRWRLGVDGIREVIEPVSQGDRRAAAARLVEDLLRPEDEIAFRLVGGGQPSLHEAVEMVLEAVPLILSVLQRDGLDDISRAKLADWLEVRQIASARRQQVLSILQLETWMADYEPALVPLLGARYVRLIIDVLDSNEPPRLVLPETLRRVRGIFDDLYNGGEIRRTELWEFLPSLVSLREPLAVSLAREYFVARLRDVPPGSVNVFVRRFAERQSRSVEEAGIWELPDPCVEGGALVQILTDRPSDIDPGTQSALVNLAVNWSAT
jgi:hypothetical protein